MRLAIAIYASAAERITQNTVIADLGPDSARIIDSSRDWRSQQPAAAWADEEREWLARRRQNVVVLCSGWKDRFCLEDTLFAGALTGRLLATGSFHTECDSAHASMDLWSLAEGDVLGYIEKAAQRHRLKRLALDDVIPYSFACDQVAVVPVFDGSVIRDAVHTSREG